MPEIVIDDVRAVDSTVWSTVDPGPKCQKFFSGEQFFVDFDRDVSGLPDALLTIPVLSQVCPVAWAVGADVRAPPVSRRFLESLRSVGSVLGQMYPSLMQGGTVVVEEAVDTRSAYGDASNVGMLFTGGVDSLSMYLHNREKVPTLINVQGWVVGIDESERWENTKAHIKGYGDRFGVETRFVRSNMLSFLDMTTLTVHFDPYHDGGWYSAVGGGIGLLGLCAPLTAAGDMGQLYIAATHWEDFPVPPVNEYWDGPGMPWGSHPALDDRIRWGKTDVVHDGFELTRQERIGFIADYIETEDPDLPIRSCADSDTAANCNTCEKCLRTAFGFVVEGVDPNDNGFDLDRSSFERAWRKIEAGEWLDDDHHAVYWKDLAERASAIDTFPVAGAEEFASRLESIDFDEIAGPPSHERLVRAIARHMPHAVFSSLYSVYDSIRTTAEPERSELDVRDPDLPDAELLGVGLAEKGRGDG